MTKTIRRIVTRIGKIGFVERLEKREKIVIAAGGLFVFCFALYLTVMSPYFEAKGKLERSLQRKQNDLVEAAILQKEYQQLKDLQGGLATRVAQRTPQFSLFSFIENMAAVVRVKNRVTYMKPSATELDDGFTESAVEMKIEEVTLAQLVDFLSKIESLENVVIIKRIAIQKNKKTSDLLDVVLNIITFEKIVPKAEDQQV